MISVKLSASRGATRCHITCVSENPCSSNSGGPLPPTRAKIPPELVLIHSEENPGNKSARSGIECVLLFTFLQCRFPQPGIWSGGICTPASDSGYDLATTFDNKPERGTCHVDRFRSPGRGQRGPAKGSQMGAGRMHSGGEGA